MKKSLITLAVASGLMVSGAAAAESKVYGHAQVEVGSWGSDADGMSVEDRARGRFGVKASEDLGGGMKGIAKFEFKVDTADGDASSAGNDPTALTGRELLVGLQTGMGQIELGRLKSAYKYYGGVSYDPFTAGILEARGNGGMSGGTFGHNGFISDSFGYEHKIGAMEFRLTYDLDDGGSETTTNATGANAFSFGFKFGTRDYEFIVALVDDDNDPSTGTNHSSTKVGGQVDMGKGGTVSLQLESMEDDTGGATTDTDVTYLDYQYPIDKNNIVDVAWGNTDVDGGSETDFMRLAVTHKFSKQTKTWVGYRSSEVTVAGVSAEASVIAVGLQKRF